MAAIFPTPHCRPATPEDSHGIANLLSDLGYPCEADDARQRIITLQQDHNQQLWVLDWHNDLLGLASIDLMYYLPLGAVTCRITALVIANHCQGRGLGKRLLQEMERAARQAGAARIELTTAKSRTEAHGFYRQMGYTEHSLRFSKALTAS
jgi:ribosomal protein S18 acetylase RimI-like enzyme